MTDRRQPGVFPPLSASEGPFEADRKGGLPGDQEGDPKGVLENGPEPDREGDPPDPDSASPLDAAQACALWYPEADLTPETRPVIPRIRPKKPFDYGYFLTGSALLAFAAFILVWTLPDMGLTDDDDFYVPAGIDYVRWLGRAANKAVAGDFSEFSRPAVERGWRNNHEHPAVAKMVMGLSWAAFSQGLGLMGQIDAARLGVILFYLFLLYLVFRFSWEIFGPAAGVFAFLALLTFPRTFYHGHVGTLDMATSATVFFVLYAAWRAETRRAWVLLAGIVYGVAMCTKLNGPFAVFPLLIYWFYRWRQSVALKERSTLRFGRMFWTGLSMALLSFPVFYLLWPWIWHDTVSKLTDYFNFHFHHYGIRLLYLGEVYLKPFAPWHAPFLYFLLTTPLVTLTLGLAGFLKGVLQLRPRNLRLFPKGPGAREDYALLMALSAFFFIGIVAFPNNPKYGGVKLFQPLFPCLAVLAGYAFSLLIEGWSARFALTRRARAVFALGAGFLLLLPGVVGMVRVYPYMLSYFNEAAGGPMGATEMGMERQYYDVCYPSMIEFWNEYPARTVTIGYEPNMGEYQRTYPWYKRDGRLHKEVRFIEPQRADYMILTHERRWSHYQELLNEYRRHPILHVERIWGVPLYTIFDRREREGTRPGRAGAGRNRPE